MAVHWLMSSRTFTEQQLIDCVRRHCAGLEREPVFLTPITTGHFNTSYFVDIAGEQLVLRIAPPRRTTMLFYERQMMKQEPALHRLLRKITDVPVPEIVAFDEGKDVIDRDYLLMRRLAGKPLSELESYDGQSVLEQLGAMLAKIHGITGEAFGYCGAHKPMTPQPTWIDAFRVMWHKLIDDVTAAGHYTAHEREEMLTLLDFHLSWFIGRDIEPRLLHMDVWQQNILVDDRDRITGLLDWDRALWGDPEIEFAVLDYCGLSQPAFWRGYGQPRETGEGAEIRNLFYMLYEIQKYIVIRQGRHNDPQGAAGYKRQVMQIVDKFFGR